MIRGDDGRGVILSPPIVGDDERTTTESGHEFLDEPDCFAAVRGHGEPRIRSEP
ncbi:unannotated protein [freshwater metagenome]|uniref:Unannotated protein n=1 Tax=freshwater metagenome TaxID=449393 RepID=A0A6J6IH04_9ZZZZ